MSATKGFKIVTTFPSPRLHAQGKTVGELFRNCLCGISSLMKPSLVIADTNVKKVKQFLRVEAMDINTLLAEFMSRVIELSDIHNLIFTNVIFKQIGDNFLEGELLGIPTDMTESEITSISYQDIDIQRNPVSGLYETTLTVET